MGWGRQVSDNDVQFRFLAANSNSGLVARDSESDAELSICVCSMNMSTSKGSTSSLNRISGRRRTDSNSDPIVFTTYCCITGQPGRTCAGQRNVVPGAERSYIHIARSKDSDVSLPLPIVLFCSRHLESEKGRCSPDNAGLQYHTVHMGSVRGFSFLTESTIRGTLMENGNGRK